MTNNFYEIRNPRNIKELNDGFNLAKDTFKNIKHNKSLYKFFGNKNYKNVTIVINLKNKKVVGFAINIFRRVKIFNKIINSAFISSICIHKNYRNKKLSILLINKCNEILKKNNVIISIVIARKKLDYYYNKFNFWGVSSFPELLVNRNSSSNLIKNKNILYSSVKKNDLISLNKIYIKVYSKINGFFYRNQDYWKFIIDKCDNEKISFVKLSYKSKILGYAVFRDNIIYEISLKQTKFYNEFLKYIFRISKKNQIIIHTNYFHEISLACSENDTKYTHRRIIYGGHLVKILNFEKLLKIYKLNKLSNQNHISDIKDFTIKFFNSSVTKGILEYSVKPQCYYFNFLDQI